MDGRHATGEDGADDEIDAPPTPESPGGSGGDARRSGVKDTRLLHRAIRDGWAVPAGLRPTIVAHLCGVVGDRGQPTRHALTAARALIDASRSNLEAIAGRPLGRRRRR